MRRNLILCGLFGLILAFWFGGKQIAVAAPLSSTPQPRIEGKSRIETAIQVSQKGWQNARTIILARADDFPDSLVAVPLSHRLDVPILLTYPTQIDNQVLAEMSRLGAEHVVILGSSNAIGAEITAALQKENISWERIEGVNRYETAVKVAEKLGGNGRVILASGENFPDALAISPYAGITETPILLTEKSSLPAVTKAQLLKLTNNEKPQTIVVGGEAVIPSATLNGIPGIQRIAGDNRYATAAKVYWFTAEEGVYAPDKAYVTTGEDFPDGLVAGALAAKQKAPLFLSGKSELPPMTYSAMRDFSSEVSATMHLIGGIPALSETVKKMVEGSVQPPYLLAGLTIAVDPGHGGRDPGATGPSGNQEKNNTLPVGLYLADLLRSAGANVMLTRSTDVSPAGSEYTELLDLKARVNLANAAKADLFVSIHNDAFSNPAAGGTTTYYSSNTSQAAASKTFGTAVQSELVKQLGLYNRGVKDAPFYVVKYTTMPAILVELGFLSNPNEEILLSSPDFQKKAALGIYGGILKYEGY